MEVSPASDSDGLVLNGGLNLVHRSVYGTCTELQSLSARGETSSRHSCRVVELLDFLSDAGASHEAVFLIILLERRGLHINVLATRGLKLLRPSFVCRLVAVWLHFVARSSLVANRAAPNIRLRVHDRSRRILRVHGRGEQTRTHLLVSSRDDADICGVFGRAVEIHRLT